MDPASITALVAVMSSGFGALLWSAAKAGRKRYEQTWQAAADAVGGEFLPMGGPWHSRTPMAVRATFEGVTVVADSYVVSNGKSSTTYTRIIAKPAHAAGVRIEVKNANVFFTLSKVLFGAQDVKLGVVEFDDTHVVKAGDEAVARAWLNRAVVRGVMSSHPYLFSLEGSTAKLVRTNLESDSALLARAMRAAAVFAARGRRMEARWTKLAASLSGSVQQELRLVDRACEGEITLLRHGTRVSVSLSRRDDHTMTAVVANRQDDVGRVIVVPAASKGYDKLIQVKTEDPAFDQAFCTFVDEAARDSLPSAEAREKILIARPARVSIEARTAEVVFDGIEMDQKRIDAAAECVALLAAASGTGPYR